MGEEKVVTYELEDEIALIGINRPEKRNALSPQVMDSLLEAVVRAGEEAKCGVIFGHGEHFCAGLDLAWAAERIQESASHRLPFPFNRNTYFEAMARGNIPFIAALQGATLGGGLETAAAAHIRVADETAFFALPEGTRGIFIGGGGAVRVARQRSTRYASTPSATCTRPTPRRAAARSAAEATGLIPAAARSRGSKPLWWARSTPNSSSRVGSGTVSLNRNRSSCASGKG